MKGNAKCDFDILPHTIKKGTSLMILAKVDTPCSASGESYLVYSDEYIQPFCVDCSLVDTEQIPYITFTEDTTILF